MIGRNLAALAVLGSAVLTAGQANAADRGFYVGLDVGQSRMDRDAALYNASQADTTSSTFTLLAGYRFSRHFELEGGYSDLGDFSATIPPLCVGGACSSEHVAVSINGIMVNAVGMLPLAEHFGLRASAGAILRRFKIVQSSQFDSFSQTDDGTVFKFGVGLAVPFNDHLEVDLNYTWYHEIGYGVDLMSGNSGTFNVPESRVAAIGMSYRF